MMNKYVDVALIVSATSVFYYGAKDEVFKAAMLPAAGYCVKKLGEYCASRGMTQIGEAMFFGGVFSAPAVAVGRTIYVLGGENVIAGVAAIGGGIAVTHEMFNYITKWALDRVPS